MSELRSKLFQSDTGILLLLALGRLVIHAVTNGQYGFHRDELAMLDNALHLSWGYVAYPPLTPLIGRIALELFGLSLVGVRLFSAFAMSAAMFLAGLTARELGGKRQAQVLTALGAAIAPISLIQGALFQYVSIDYLWWVLIAYLMVRLLKTENPRWWLAIGTVIGLGMMTKYTIAYFIAGLVGGIILTKARQYLLSPWLWGGVALSLAIFTPNLIWQFQHEFISLEFLTSIHARDVAIGRTQGYLIEQLFVATNLFTIPIWIAGLYFFFFNANGVRYRPLGWMYVIPFILFLYFQGRSYYLAPAYPMLIAGGAVSWERWTDSFSTSNTRLIRGVTWAGLAVGGIVFIPVMLPVAPVNSVLWDFSSEVHDNFVEQIGWPELVETVSVIYYELPPDARSRVGILTSNYGEAGAINLFGPNFGLPQAISGINSYWLRGYGDPAPDTVILVGFPVQGAHLYFTGCKLAGFVTNRYDVENEETRFHPEIFTCGKPRLPWPQLWLHLKSFG